MSQIPKFVFAFFANVFHSEMNSIRCYEEFEKTKGHFAEIVRAGLKPIVYFHGLDAYLWPWLRPLLEDLKCVVGSSPLTHAFAPFIRDEVKYYWWDQGTTGFNGGETVYFAPEFCCHEQSFRSEDERIYFYIGAGPKYLASDIDMDALGDSDACSFMADKRVGLVMHQKRFGPLIDAWQKFKTDPFGDNENKLIESMQYMMALPADSITIIPFDSEDYCIGSACGSFAFLRMLTLMGEIGFNKHCVSLPDVLPLLQEKSQDNILSSYPKRSLAKWTTHLSQMQYFRDFFEAQNKGLTQSLITTDLERIAIAGITDFTSSIRWQETGPRRFEGRDKTGQLMPIEISGNYLTEITVSSALQSIGQKHYYAGKILSQHLSESGKSEIGKRMIKYFDKKKL